MLESCKYLNASTFPNFPINEFFLFHFSGAKIDLLRNCHYQEL